MTDAPSPARARAEAAFRRIEVTPEQKQDALAEYRANQAAALDNMARLRAARLAKGNSSYRSWNPHPKSMVRSLPPIPQPAVRGGRDRIGGGPQRAGRLHLGQTTKSPVIAATRLMMAANTLTPRLANTRLVSRAMCLSLVSLCCSRGVASDHTSIGTCFITHPL